MMMLCIDASIGVKWFVPEHGQQEALGLLEVCGGGGHELVLPDLFFVEVANGLRHHFLNGHLTEPELQDAVKELAQLDAEVVSAVESVSSAVELAADFSLTTWDAIYLAVADAHDAIFWTADRDFADIGSEAVEVRLLEWEE